MREMLGRIATVALVALGCTRNVVAATSQQPASEPVPVDQSIAERVHVIGTCQFHMKDMFGGFYEDSQPGDSPPQGFYHVPDSGPGHSPALYGGFALYCIDAGNTDLVDAFLEAKNGSGQWMRANVDGSSEPFDNDERFRAVTFNGSNWTGHGTLMDDTVGEESKRSRWLRFCLVHDRLALCGKARVGLLAPEKVDELQRAQAILKSIQFVDDEPLRQCANSVRIDDG